MYKVDIIEIYSNMIIGDLQPLIQICFTSYIHNCLLDKFPLYLRQYKYTKAGYI